MAEQPQQLRATYNDVHKLIRESVKRIADFKPNLIIAIGGGGFFPARVLRTFLKDPTTNKDIPIHAIGLSLYEPVLGVTPERLGTEVVRIQWPASAKIFLGKRILIVDEVDDSRTTLQYALAELQKDVNAELQKLSESERDKNHPEFAVFVVHNKLKEKVGKLPATIPYYTGAEVPDLWLAYPWEAEDIDEHDRLAALQK
ncbi:PRTase-like protein [Thelephora ganbajun]|uniref:PRTase-like protein n=1 Tax=Thelephora ganbajun TaxID=370292 RepID=A0ACB6ZA38_THEGA|nr:PRTase-like protein [Thelephora ganbajun]